MEVDVQGTVINMSLNISELESLKQMLKEFRDNESAPLIPSKSSMGII